MVHIFCTQTVSKHSKHCLESDNGYSFRYFIEDENRKMLIKFNINLSKCVLYSYKKNVNYYKRVKRSKLENNKELVYKDMLWKGGVYRKLPFGYGHFYDKEGNRIFSGFLFEGKRIGVGVEYYPNSQSQSIAYYGLYMNDMRHGWGVSYDEDDNVVYEGEWVNNAIRNSDQTTAVLKEDRDVNFHNRISSIIIEDHSYNTPVIRVFNSNLFYLLEKLIIGNYCLNGLFDFDIQQLHHLKSISIGNNSLNNCELFNIQQCENLLSIIVGDNSFNKSCEEDKCMFSVCDCHRLSSIIIGQDSFCNYAILELKGMIVVIDCLNSRSFIPTNS